MNARRLARPRGAVIGLAVAAAALIIATLWLPLWTMSLEAPQYPAGLHMRAYGDRITGDLYEINIINHYVGMAKIDEVPAPEMTLFPYAVYALALACLAAPLNRRLLKLTMLAVAAMPVMVLADLQWWLHVFGRNLDPTAPLSFIEPFTPLAIGISKIGNFCSVGMVSYGLVAMVLAVLLLWTALRKWPVPAAGSSKRLSSSLAEEAGVMSCQARIAAVLLALCLAPVGAGASWHGSSGSLGDLQARIDAAAPGSTLVIESGTYSGPVRVQGPLTLEGVGRPVIEGDRRGSVVEVSGDGVRISGFTLRSSGRATSVEAAGIKTEGSNHVFSDNVITDVYFGVHLEDGSNALVRGNRIEPGIGDGVRPGHAVSLWYRTGDRVIDNVIVRARDGVYLTFADDVLVSGNTIVESRYGVHSMYSQRSTFVGNTLRANLVGTALMYSRGLTMRCNRIERHREGATAYAILLKDIDDLVLEGNQLIGNRVGIYADNTPLGRGHEAIVRNNLFAGNLTALALQSTVRLTFSDNQLIDNLTMVRSEGGRLAPENRWSVDGRGNYWDDYHGFDRDGDGIGDLDYRYETILNAMVRKQPLLRAFLFTPAHLAIESAARMFPVIRREPLVTDEFPLMTASSVGC